MHFTSVLAATASLLALGLAADPLAFTSWPQDIAAGKPLTLTWTGAATNEPVVLTLRKGASGDLNDVEVITDQAKDGKFTWTPGENIKEGEPYAFQVSQGGQVNYSSLLKAGAPANPPASGVSQTGAAATTSAPTGATSQATETASGATNTSSKPLISSSAATPASSSASAQVTSSSVSAEAPFGTGDSVINGKNSDDSDAKTGLASVSQYSAGLAAGAMALFFYMGF